MPPVSEAQVDIMAEIKETPPLSRRQNSSSAGGKIGSNASISWLQQPDTVIGPWARHLTLMVCGWLLPADGQFGTSALMRSSQPWAECFTHVFPVMIFILLEFQLHSSQSRPASIDENPLLSELSFFKQFLNSFPPTSPKWRKTLWLLSKKTVQLWPQINHQVD